MARDCPDRQRGADWRNGPPLQGGMPGRSGPTAGRIGGDDVVDREMEVSLLLNSALLTKLLTKITATHARIIWWCTCS